MLRMEGEGLARENSLFGKLWPNNVARANSIPREISALPLNTCSREERYPAELKSPPRRSRERRSPEKKLQTPRATSVFRKTGRSSPTREVF